MDDIMYIYHIQIDHVDLVDGASVIIAPSGERALELFGIEREFVKIELIGEVCSTDRSTPHIVLTNRWG